MDMRGIPDVITIRESEIALETGLRGEGTVIARVHPLVLLAFRAAFLVYEGDHFLRSN